MTHRKNESSSVQQGLVFIIIVKYFKMRYMYKYKFINTTFYTLISEDEF